MEHLAQAGKRVVQALQIVRRRALDALESVEVFSELSCKQIETLYGAMARAPYNAGETIFEQDEPGDTFYVIIDGEAEVTRWEDGDEHFIARMGPGDVFGERALIKQEARYATIKAVTKLKSASATRDDFERVIGAPLSKIMSQLHNRRDSVNIERRASLAVGSMRGSVAEGAAGPSRVGVDYDGG